MWNLPGLGIEPMSPALTCRFLFTAPPEKSKSFLFFLLFFWSNWVACGILVPLSGIELRALAVKVPGPNYWTTREFPHHFLFKQRKRATQERGYYPLIVTLGKKCSLDLNKLFMQDSSILLGEKLPCSREKWTFFFPSWDISSFRIFSAHTERLLQKDNIPRLLASGGDEFNPGSEMRLDRSELLCNKVWLKYEGDRESFWHRRQRGQKEYPPASLQLDTI